MMISIIQVMAHQYAHTSDEIHSLKQKALKTTEIERHDGFKKVKVPKVVEHIHPKHELWPRYQQAKRRANVILGAKLLLKYNDATNPSIQDLDPLVKAGILKTQASTPRAQKNLGRAAQRLLARTAKHMENHPERFKAVEEWVAQREEAAHA